MAQYESSSVSSGEMAQRFIEFVMIQAQNAAFMLGQIPHPQTNKPEVNLDMARLLIDQLAMIQEKTKGNLNKDESRILSSTLSNLQMAYVEASRGERPGSIGEVAGAPETTAPVEDSAPPSSSKAPDTAAEPEGRKKFVKSYGS